MKKIIIYFSFLALLSCIYSCKKSSSSGNEYVPAPPQQTVYSNYNNYESNNTSGYSNHEEVVVDDVEPQQYSTTESNSFFTEDTDNSSRYYNYEETPNCVDGVVVYEGSGDYYIVETRRGYTVLETYRGFLSEGDNVRGELNRYGFKYIIKKRSDREVRVYIEDFMLSDRSAVEWLGDHDKLNYRDQKIYDQQ